jgi:ribosomal protein L1
MLINNYNAVYCGKIVIAVLTNEENFEEATNAGADTVGNDELIEKLIKETSISIY